MIISPSSLDTNLSQLLDEVNTGKTQLPEFQRDWTWDDGRICGIIASLSQGYPMGAIMRLQYGNPEIKFKYRTKVSVMKQIQLRFCLNGIGVEYLEKCMAVPMRPDMQMIWKML